MSLTAGANAQTTDFEGFYRQFGGETNDPDLVVAHPLNPVDY
jgi:hypothetical protein